MTIKVYCISDDERKLVKNLVDSGDNANLIGSYTVNMKEGGNVLNPTFSLSGADLHAANYCYIARYDRYYFIDPPTVDPAGRWTMHCRCDVLMSHASELAGLKITLERSESTFNGR